MITRASLVSVIVVTLAACGGGSVPTSITSGATLSLSVSGLLPLDPEAVGHYEAWVVGRSGATAPLGEVDPRSGSSFTFTNPLPDASSFLITYETRASTDAGPSAQRLLAGPF